ncbi:hypothetical protein F975_00847 [Acinetobacter sp. ANC 3789]|uniref:dynamin family protein n=1 Tax=Acinetobacter sp. ANC 3789 TaxID=1217714 RepID=UPI0002D0E176|nr:dynamin family protein [Acinetobacter sp. ANC 3789]ENU80989.1 hypothetical protein F975_00847 [Acinetobacter sp. ANC 3789]
MDKKLKLAFFATMSSGKTTCINALLGTELLHSANEATTATITTISHADETYIFCYDENQFLLHQSSNFNFDSIKVLNAAQDISYIEIASKFEVNRNLVIVDTPGANNSRDLSHRNLSYKYLSNYDGYIVYVINASQPFINDDFVYIKHILSNINKDKIIFLVNKLDVLDSELESVEGFLANLREYFKSLGFDEPKFFLVSAYHALILKKIERREHLTGKERRVFLKLLGDKSDNEFLKHLNLPEDITLRIDETEFYDFLDNKSENLKKLYLNTGFPYFEEFIKQGLSKKI